MNQKQGKQWVLLGSLIVLVLSLTACNFGMIETGTSQEKSETVEVGGAETAVVNIAMGFGELTVSDGADDLMDAEFTYNVEDWEPEVNYAVSGSNGRLNITQPDSEFAGIPDSDIVNKWELQLNNDIPMEIDVKLGAGENNLDLRSLNLERLSVESGAGSSTISLGDSPLRIVDIQAGVGEMNLDLSGSWEEDANITIETGFGDTSIVVPSDVGVIIHADLGIGDLDANGFRVQGDNYVNDAYGESSTTLSIDLQGGAGGITLQLEE